MVSGQAGTYRLAAAAVLILTALVYAPLRSAGYVYEDEAWSRPSVSVLRIPGRAIAYRPMVGQAPGIAHLEQVGLHLVNGALVYALGSTLLTPAVGVCAATIFLLHPLNSEAVSYLKARSDVLMTTWVLLAVLLAARGPAWWRPFAWLALFVCAAMTDEFGVLAPVLVALTAWAYRWYRTALPLVVVGVGVCAVAGMIASLPALHVWLAQPHHYGWLAFWRLQLVAVWHLLALLAWPVPLSIDHEVVGLGPAWSVWAAIGTLLTGAAISSAWRRTPVAAWAVAWVVLCLAPRFVVQTSEFLVESQLYLPMVGISVGLGALVARWLESSWTFSCRGLWPQKAM